MKYHTIVPISKYLIKFVLFTSTVFLLPVTYSHGEGKPTAQEVANISDKLPRGKTMVSDTMMYLIDDRGNQRVRELKNYRKECNDVTKIKVLFKGPADVRNTAYLNYEWASGADDDSWLFLPALRKVKRIAGGDKSNAFMGSDFNFSDMNGFVVSDWDYKFLQDEVIDGHDCYVIEATPKESVYKKVISETGYTKRHLWIRKDNYVNVKAKNWMKRGRKVKIMEVADLKKIQGIWVSGKISMVTLKGNRRLHASVLKVNDPEFFMPLDDTLFATSSMDRGL
jgi:hypothetical protein